MNRAFVFGFASGAPRRGAVRLQRFARGSLIAATLLATAWADAQGTAPTEPTFEIQRYAVDGNSVLANATLDATLAPYTGAGRSLADVQAALAELRAAYARAGFGAVQVLLPEQQIASGIVRFQVIEARLRSVRIVGNTHVDDANVRRSLPSLRTGAPPNTDDLAREIRLANENPAKRIAVDLKSESAEQIDALVSVEDEKAWKVGALLDNTGTPSTGRTRVGTFLQHANAADRDQVATLQYVTSPGRIGDVTVAALNYRIPLPTLGDAVDVFAIHADVDSGVVGEAFNVRGRGDVLGLRYTQTLRPTASWRHRWLYGFEYRKVDNRVGAVGSTPDLVPDVVLHPASVGYAATWSGSGRQLDVSATVVRNLPGGEKGDAGAFTASRGGASANYAVLRYAANHIESLPADWQLRIVAEGQATRDALVSGEQFGIGGQDSVRGFDEREIIGDRGLRATLELQTPDFGARLGPGVAARGLAFVDHGSVRRNHPLPGEVVRTNISSVGVGMRLEFAPSWHLRVDAAHVTQGGNVRPRGDERLHFSIGMVY